MILIIDFLSVCAEPPWFPDRRFRGRKKLIGNCHLTLRIDNCQESVNSVEVIKV